MVRWVHPWWSNAREREVARPGRAGGGALVKYMPRTINPNRRNRLPAAAARLRDGRPLRSRPLPLSLNHWSSPAASAHGRTKHLVLSYRCFFSCFFPRGDSSRPAGRYIAAVLARRSSPAGEIDGLVDVWCQPEIDRVASRRSGGSRVLIDGWMML